jgi:GT2 family glycosyltransferase
MSGKTNTLDISVIIPFKDKASMTLTCVRSLYKYGPGVKEIVLLSNNSSESELQIIKEFATVHDNVVLWEYNHPFNYQKLNNWAVSKVKGAFIMFLNNDTELLPASRGLLEKMYKKASESEVGITGCLLLYGDNITIQHAGVFLMPRGMADHMYVGKKLKTAIKRKGSKEFPYDVTQDRPMTAVTGAVNIVERKKFLAVGGYNEKFIIGGGDVDLCIRLNKVGYQTWFVAGGHIIHKESQSRARIPLTYNDFYRSYLSYIQGYDSRVGDPFLPLITQGME